MPIFPTLPAPRLDIRLIRDNATLVKERLATRDASLSSVVDEVLTIDAQRQQPLRSF